MSKLVNKYIETNPEILGGTPVVKGTRISIERIKFLVKQGYTTEDLKEEYPQVKPATIQSIISYLMGIGLDEYEKTQKVQASVR